MVIKSRELKGCRDVACMEEMRNGYKILVAKCDSAYFPVARRCENFNEHSRLYKLGRNPLDEGSARRRDLYQTTDNTRKRKTCIPPAGIRTSIRNKRAVEDPRARSRCHRDWPHCDRCL